MAYFKLGKLKISKAYYASVLEVDPEDDEARGLMEIMTTLEKRQHVAQRPAAGEYPEQEPDRQ